MKETTPNYIFHLAGSKHRSMSLSNFVTNYKINYEGTLNLYKALINSKELYHIISMGTIDEYGITTTPYKENQCELPISAYGLSKLAATKLSLIFSHQYNLPITVLRPSIAYGPGQGEEMFIPMLLKALLKDGFFNMTEGKQLRDFIFIDDLTNAMCKSLNVDNINGQVINIASGVSQTVKETATQIANLVGVLKGINFGAIPYKSSEIMDYSINIGKARELLRWAPSTPLERGLSITIES